MNIESLPIEVITSILSYFESDVQRQIRRVCRLWFNVINYTHFTLGLILKSESDEFIKCFGRYNQPIGLRLTKDNKNSFLSDRSVSKITALTQLTQLDITTCRSKGISYRQLTNLISLKTKHIRQSDLQRLTNLTQLELWSTIKIKDSTRPLLPTSLVSLQFTGYDTSELLHKSRI